MTLYLDTSSLVKLYVAETGSEIVRQLAASAAIIATSAVTYPETRAALARLRRERALTSVEFASAKRQFDADWPAYLVLEASAALCRTAGELAEKYRLRGFDSIHLASFEAIARRAGVSETRFSSFDDRQTEAARKLARILKRVE